MKRTILRWFVREILLEVWQLIDEYTKPHFFYDEKTGRRVRAAHQRDAIRAADRVPPRPVRPEPPQTFRRQA